MERIEKALTASPRVETIILGDANHGFIGHEQQLADALNSWVQRN
jgi:dienelactone hydrolase